MKFNIFFQDSSPCCLQHIDSGQFKSEWKDKELAALIYYYSGRFEIKEHTNEKNMPYKST